MFIYILKRIAQALLIVFIVATVVFIILRGVGNPASLLLSPEGTTEDYEQLQETLGINKPLYIQYIDYMSNVLKGDFGNSFFYNRPVIELLKEHIPATLILVFTAIAIAVPIALITGIISAIKRGTLVDSTVTTVAITGWSLPQFWLGLMLMLIFSVWLKILPTSGYEEIKSLILPAVTLSTGLLATTIRLTRSSMLNVMQQDYITTARSKGLKERYVILSHGLKNALLSVVTMIALQIGHLLGGSVVVETVFAWPGLGRLIVEAVTNYDYPLVQASAIALATIFAVVNLVVDLLYTVIDPRIRDS